MCRALSEVLLVPKDQRGMDRLLREYRSASTAQLAHLKEGVKRIHGSDTDGESPDRLSVRAS